MYTNFIDFIQFSIGKKVEWTKRLSAQEWLFLFESAKKQTVIGILFSGIQKLQIEYRPPKDILLKWIIYTENIKSNNNNINKECIDICKHFEENGFYTCILKGQGNAKLYPHPDLRTPGDIDIWVWPKCSNWQTSKLSERRYLIRKFIGKRDFNYNHTTYPIFKHTEVEVHFTPTCLNNFKRNNRLQEYILKKAHDSFTNSKCQNQYSTPIWELNAILQLIHIQKHVLWDGIGLRHLMDFYYLLQQKQDASNIKEFITTVETLGLKNIFSSVIWVLIFVFKLEKRFIIISPYEEGGKILLDEILQTGNFGKVETIKENKYSILKTLKKFHRSFRFSKINFNEILWLLPFKIWHWFWRKHMNRNVK